MAPTYDYSTYQPPSIPDALASSDVQLQSPYYNLGSIDPRSLSQLSGADYLFEDAPQRKRSFSERACLTVGLSYFAGMGIGGVWGFIEGIRHPAATSGRLKVTTVLNGVTKRGPAVSNSLGVVALMYSSINYAIVSARPSGNDDIINQTVAGAAAGALYKCTAGPRAMAIASLTGATLLAAGTVAEAVVKGEALPNPVERIKDTVYN